MSFRYNWNITIENVKDFDLKQIFDCGQCFRWEPSGAKENRSSDGSNQYDDGNDRSNNADIWEGLAQDKPAAMKYDSESGILKIASAENERFWRNYLDLDRDYSEIKKLLSKDDSEMTKAIECGSGIRILNQDAWETVVSFIISQNNNITRIKKCINSLAQNLGTPVINNINEQRLYALPDAKRLAKATEEELAPCKLGYRAKYLIEAGKQISQNNALCEAAGLDTGKDFLTQLRDESVSGEFASKALQNICGVGPKVANCIALFGLGKFDSFPLDVWMKRAMNQVYGIDEKDTKAMKEYALKHFGSYGGIAQQYLFNYFARL